MLIRCAWCKGIIGDKPPYGSKYDKEITDGICPECSEKYFGIKEKGGKVDVTIKTMSSIGL